MAGRGYGAVVQTRAAAAGNDFMLVLFYRAAKWRCLWQEERSRVLLAALQRIVQPGEAPGRVGLGGRGGWVGGRRVEVVCL